MRSKPRGVKYGTDGKIAGSSHFHRDTPVLPVVQKKGDRSGTDSDLLTATEPRRYNGRL